MPRVEKPKNDLRVPEWHSQKGKWSLNFEGKQCDQDKMVGFMFMFFKKKRRHFCAPRRVSTTFGATKDRPLISLLENVAGKVAERFRSLGAQNADLKPRGFEFIQPLARVGGGGLSCGATSAAELRDSAHEHERRSPARREVDVYFLLFCFESGSHATHRAGSFLSQLLVIVPAAAGVCEEMSVGDCGGAGGDDDGRSSRSSGSVTKLWRVAVSQLSMAADWIQTSPGL